MKIHKILPFMSNVIIETPINNIEYFKKDQELYELLKDELDDKQQPIVQFGATDTFSKKFDATELESPFAVNLTLFPSYFNMIMALDVDWIKPQTTDIDCPPVIIIRTKALLRK